MWRCIAKEAFLSAGALLDFRAHVEGLLARGDRAGALVLWESVVVFIHDPHIPDAEFVVDGLPPLEECPCTLSPCPRCEQGRGVSVSRGSGFGLAVVFWPSLERHRPKCGVDTMLTWRGWISCSWRHLRPGGCGRISCPSMWSGCFTGWMPPLRADSAARLGAGGSWGGPANQHMNRSWDSPLAGQWGPGERSGTGRAASPVALNFSHRCVSLCQSLRLPLATAAQYARTAAAILGLAAPSAMAQEHGIYALWTPESALDKALAARVQEWRRERGLLHDKDFAFAFSTYEQAKLQGDFGLADRWLAAQEESLVPDAARVTTGARCAPHHPRRLLPWQGIGE